MRGPMLMPSPRHRPVDLRLWAQLEEADSAYAQASRPRLNSLANEAEKSIRDFIAGGACYLGTSWGKDSVVLLNLAQRTGVSMPVVYVRITGASAANPDCDAVRDAYLSSASIEYHELTFRHEDCPHDEHWRECDRRWGGRRITGLRMDESGRRAMSVRRLGIDTGRSCRPLAKWTGADIFAWLHLRKLPVHPVYAMLGGGRWPREQIRCHSIGGETASNYGRREHEREYYGDVLNRLVGNI